ncbi:hypothetical protein RBU49_11035 [Clostridium sp. MB40-C1]|uniref:hypothetical protein n=1 Tax=Clostridium sp. MB40-C1 TaxID=3070996 RepID=UPI0027DF1BE9|nr:hypothetical protein [Clostridium sp. MB40-C1]WMJ79424.1 hypothetical protein RBU49_11035 [Clostridium sp. MB40-C1]
MNYPKFQDLPPLADKGIYIASQSTFYGILTKENLQHHRRNTSIEQAIHEMDLKQLKMQVKIIPIK